MSEIHLAPISIISVSYAVSIGLSVWVRNLLLKRAVFDQPNERSLHRAPVPRGGGLAILAVLVPGMLITALVEKNLPIYAGLITGTLILAFISWYDDRKGARVIARFSLQLFAACLGSLAFPANETIFFGALPFWLDRVLMIIGWVWFTNLYNFMDGIDGITGTETVSITLGACLVLAAAGLAAPFVPTLTLLLAGACLGFLALNWYPAKLFLGDVGSIPIGFVTGFILLTLAVKGQIAAAIILPLYYLADSGITLLRRAMRGAKVWQAHREHFYQKMAHVVRRHDFVVYRILIANLLLIGAALLSVKHPAQSLIAAALIVAILMGNMSKAFKQRD